MQDVIDIEVTPLSAAYGAEIKGVDLTRPVSESAVRAIKRAWTRHLVSAAGPCRRTTNSALRPISARWATASARPRRSEIAPTTKDAQFLAEAEKLNLPLVDPVSGPDREKIIASLYAAPPALVARTQAMVAQ
jgi:alpha-ketoglutarate-dependent taurine dioxygenase